MSTKRLIEQCRGARGPVLTPVRPDDGDREARILAHQQRVQAELPCRRPAVEKAASPEKTCRCCGNTFHARNGRRRCWRCLRDRVYSKAV